VQFIHLTAREFLLSTDGSADPLTLGRAASNATIAVCCLQYLRIALMHPELLSTDDQSSEYAQTVDYLSQYHLLQYCLDHVHRHYTESAHQKPMVRRELVNLVADLDSRRQSIASRLVEHWIRSTSEAFSISRTNLEDDNATVSSTDDLLMELLTTAAHIGQYETSEVLLSLFKDFATTDHAGTRRVSRPLIAAAQSGHVGIVQMLVDKGADLNASDEYGNTALLYAAEEGLFHAVRHLLDMGSDPNISNKHRRTAIMYAASEGHIEAVQILRGKGADVEARDRQWWNALIHASQRGCLEMTKLLLRGGAKFNACDSQGRDALIHASKRGYLDIVKVLLDFGANLYIYDSKGRDALINASQAGHLDVIQLLLDRGADVNVRDVRGCTALFYTTKRGHRQASRLLVDAGANVDALRIPA
jgi:ankyrin repeat protein